MPIFAWVAVDSVQRFSGLLQNGWCGSVPAVISPFAGVFYPISILQLLRQHCDAIKANRIRQRSYINEREWRLR
jgi:hypothetical protein